MAGFKVIGPPDEEIQAAAELILREFLKNPTEFDCPHCVDGYLDDVDDILECSFCNGTGMIDDE